MDLFDDNGALFSEDRRYRYKLWRIWDRSQVPLVWVGCNPSIADEEELDPTLRRVRKFTMAWGHGGFVMLNLFALVSTDPLGLLEVDDPVGAENDSTIRHETVGRRVICAWGRVGGQYADRVKDVVSMLPRRLECLRTTKEMHPEHPLYIPGDTQPIEWSPR